MFPVPQDISTTIFADMPAHLRLKGRKSGWTAGRHQTSLEAFLEGPSFDRDGNLYVTDIPFGRIFRISPVGEWEVATEYGGWPNGLKIHKDGRIFIADHKLGLVQLDPKNGKIEIILDKARREGFKGLNDLVFASSGDLYFTDQGQTGLEDPTGRVYCLRATGRLDCLISNVPSPNGLVLSRDERTLYVAVTRGKQIWQLPLQEDGPPSKVGVYIHLMGGVGGPDGLALDQNGSLAIAHPSLGSVWLFDHQGIPTHRIRSCAGLSLTNIAYGGADNRSLFITDSSTSKILRAEMPAPGQKMYSHM